MLVGSSGPWGFDVAWHGEEKFAGFFFACVAGEDEAVVGALEHSSDLGAGGVDLLPSRPVRCQPFAVCSTR